MAESETQGKKEISAYLDRIEELEDGSAKAVFLFEDEEGDFIEFVLPTDLLPADAEEGEYLTITISRDKDKTADALDEARQLLKVEE